MKVNWIEISNIKSYKTATKIILNEDQNFIVGPNGSGKTTALQALAVCLLTLVPKMRSFSSGRDGSSVQKLQMQADQHPIRLPANYLNKDGIRTISIELSLESSFDGLRSEYKKYLELFDQHIDVIQANFWSTDGLLADIGRIISGLEECKERVFELCFDVGFQNLSLRPDSRNGKEVILDALSFIESLRMIYEFLLKRALVEEHIERGFNLVYLGADRTVNFSGEVGLSKGGFNDLFNNSSRGQSASLNQYIFSSNSFDYISQSLLKTVEQVSSMRWQKGDLDAVEKIDELEDIKTTLKSILGYELIVNIPPSQFDNFSFTFLDGEVEVSFDQLSTGEKSLIYFIFTLANPDIKNSFIIVDEAEVHLHGNMQGKLLKMIEDKASLNNQLFISTHSPEMINTLTISSVLRFYKDKGQTNYVNFRTDADIGTKYDIIRLVNSQNNEKVFFADRVILVEGIKDRIFFENLLKKTNNTNKIIEVVDVGGKQNFGLYKDYLDEIKVPTMIFADLDYLYDINKSDLSSLLVKNEKKVDEIVKGKGSADRKALVAQLEDYLSSGNKEEVTKLLEYIKKRGVTLKDDLPPEDIAHIKQCIADRNRENIFFPSAAYLKDRVSFSGEIEDFLKHIPQGVSSSDAIHNLVEYASTENFIEDLRNSIDTELLKELDAFIETVLS